MIRSFPDLEFVGLDRGAWNGTPAEAAGHVVGVPSQGSQSKLNTKIRVTRAQHMYYASISFRISVRPYFQATAYGSHHGSPAAVKVSKTQRIKNIYTQPVDPKNPIGKMKVEKSL